MSGFEQVAWFPLCAGLTAVGLVASWLVWRRRGGAAGLRLAAWSLLPLAAYLTGIVTVLWRVGTAIASWAAGLVFSPIVWAGVALAGLSVVAFVVSGVLRGRRARAAASGEADSSRAVASPRSRQVGTASSSSGSSGTGASAGDDEDFSDVEEILRRRGIT